MRSRLRPTVVATLTLGGVGLVACSLAYPIEGFSESGDGGSSSDAPVDTTTPDVGTPIDLDAGDAASPSPLPPLNLFPAGTFELDEECSGLSWAITAANVTRVSGGHDSPGACRICSTQPGVVTAFDYYPLFNPPLAIGDTYQSRIWVRSLAAPQTIESRLRLFDEDEGYVEQTTSGNRPVGTEWTEIVVTHVVRGTSRRVNPVFFSFPASAGECYLIDDIAVYKLE